jgi:hypothetical protein
VYRQTPSEAEPDEEIADDLSIDCSPFCPFERRTDLTHRQIPFTIRQ